MASLAQHVGEAVAPVRVALADRDAMEDLLNANRDAVIPIFLVCAGTFAVVLIPAGYAFGWLANRLAVKR